MELFATFSTVKSLVRKHHARIPNAMVRKSAFATAAGRARSTQLLIFKNVHEADDERQHESEVSEFWYHETFSVSLLPVLLN